MSDSTTEDPRDLKFSFWFGDKILEIRVDGNEITLTREQALRLLAELPTLINHMPA